MNLTKVTPTLRTWLLEGRCPLCGSLGSLDWCGGARCPVDGLYALVLHPPEINSEEPFPTFKFADLWNRKREICKLGPAQGNCTTRTVPGPQCLELTTAVMADGFACLEKLDTSIEMVGMSKNTGKAFIAGNLDNVIKQSNLEWAKKGFYGVLWNAKLFLLDSMPDNEVHILSRATLDQCEWPDFHTFLHIGV